MNLRKELDELRRKARLDECPACGTYDIEVVWGPKPGEEREDKPVEPCHVCGKRPIVVNWSS